MSGRRRELVLQRQPLSNLLVALPLLLVLSVSCSATTETRGADDETIDLWDSFGGKGETRRNGTIEIDEPKAPFSQRGNENNDDTLSRRLKDRIIGGTPVAEGEYPFYAFPIGMLLCGATLIAPQILLTAAHCGEVWTSAGALLGTWPGSLVHNRHTGQSVLCPDDHSFFPKRQVAPKSRAKKAHPMVLIWSFPTQIMIPQQTRMVCIAY